MKPESRRKLAAAFQRFAEEEKRYGEEKKDIEKAARKHEAVRDRNQAKDPYFDYAEVLLQIAIVMGAVSIMSKAAAPFYVEPGSRTGRTRPDRQRLHPGVADPPAALRGCRAGRTGGPKSAPTRGACPGRCSRVHSGANVRNLVVTIGGPRRRPGWVAVVALALLVLQLLLQLQTADATLKIVWRLLVLSFDNPATQVLDELACEKSPCHDSTRDVLTIAGVAAEASRRTESSGPELLAQRVDLIFGITRSPPQLTPPAPTILLVVPPR